MDGKKRKHVIQRQVFEITTKSKDKAYEVHRDIGLIYRTRILPIIEKVFDEFSVDGYVLRIDKLELDIGNLNSNEFEQQLESKIKFELTQQLIEARAKAERKAIASGNIPRLVPIGPAKLETLIYFLKNGRLAPGSDLMKESVDELMEEMIALRPGQFLNLLSQVSRSNDRVISRMVRQFSDENLKALLKLVATSREPMLSRFIRKMETEHKHYQSIPKAEYLATIRESVFRYLLTQKGKTFQSKTFLEQVRLTLSEKSGKAIELPVTLDEVATQEKALKKEGSDKVINLLLRSFSRKSRVLGKYDTSEVLDWAIRNYPVELLQRLRISSRSSLKNILQGMSQTLPVDQIKALINLIAPGRRYWVSHLFIEIEKALPQLQARVDGKSRADLRSSLHAILIESLINQSGKVINEEALSAKIIKELPDTPDESVSKSVQPIIELIFSQSGPPDDPEETPQPIDKDTWFRAQEARERDRGMPIQARIDTIAYFFFYGEMPWWAPEWKRADLEKELDFFLERQAPAFKETFETLFISVRSKRDFRNFAVRFVNKLSPERLEKWIQTLVPDLSGFIITIVLALEKLYHGESDFIGTKVPTAKGFAWIPVLWVLFEQFQKGKDTPQVNEWVEEMTSYSAKFIGKDLGELKERMSKIAEQAADDGETRFRPLVNMLGMAAFGQLPTGGEEKVGEETIIPDPYGYQEFVEAKANEIGSDSESSPEIPEASRGAEQKPEIGDSESGESLEDGIRTEQAGKFGALEDEKRDLKEEDSEEPTEGKRKSKDIDQTEDRNEGGQGKEGEESVMGSEMIENEGTTNSEDDVEKREKEKSIPEEGVKSLADSEDDVEKREKEKSIPEENVKSSADSEDDLEQKRSEDSPSLETVKDSTSKDSDQPMKDKKEGETEDSTSKRDVEEESEPIDLKKLPMEPERILNWYLSHGSIPFQVSYLKENQVFELFEQVLEKDPSSLERILRKALTQTAVRVRLIKNLPEELIWKIIDMLRPSYAKGLRKFYQGLRPLFTAAGSPAPPELVLEHALFFVVDNSQDTFASFTYLKNMTRYLVRRTSSDMLRVSSWMEESSGKAGVEIRKDVAESAEVLRKQAEKLPSAGEKLEIKLPDTLKPNLPKDGEPIFVKNAGMVILWPFYVHLFKYLNMLTPGKNFKDDKAAHRAVHVMQYCATEKENSPEWMLPLNKLLCELPLDEPIEAGIKLTDDEKELCDKLVQSACRQWEPMKNTKPSAFRGAFCVRDGKLVYKNEKWTLIVEQGPWDMLMDKMSWGVSMVRLPWMKKMLNVTWR